MASPFTICLRCQSRLLSASRASHLRIPSIASRNQLTSTKPGLASRSVQLRSRPQSRTRSFVSLQHTRPRSLRSFSSTARRRDQVILNPRQDEDGNDMMVEITPRAANRLKEIMANERDPNLALRISVESGGCHGFQYLMSLTNMSKISQEEDTVFQGRDEAKVVMDEPSLELLKGSKVDYTMELIGSQFKIADNPKATSSCGCGTSFDIKA